LKFFNFKNNGFESHKSKRPVEFIKAEFIKTENLENAVEKQPQQAPEEAAPASKKKRSWIDSYQSQAYFGPPEPVPNPLAEALSSFSAPTPRIDDAIRSNIDPTWSSEDSSRPRSTSDDDLTKFWLYDSSIPEELQIQFSSYNKKLLKKLKAQQYIIDKLNLKIQSQDQKIEALSNALMHSL